MWTKENVRALVIILATAILAVLGYRVVPVAGCACTNTQPTPPGITPPGPIGVQPDTLAAIGKCSRDGVGCSFTIIGPRRVDGAYDILFAAHCVNRVGEIWTATLRDGRKFGFRVVNFNRTADYAWGVTTGNAAELPFALLADSTPPAGTKVWHAGYGIHIPSNREDGTVTQEPNTDGQIEYRLSVSPGDSGGGIVMDASGRVLSPVCCTTSLGAVGRVWGASPEAARTGRVVMVNGDEWIPVQMPTRPDNYPVKTPTKQ